METLKINYNNNSSELCILGQKYDTDKSCLRKNISNTVFEVAQSTQANQVPLGVVCVDNGLLANFQPSAFIEKSESGYTWQIVVKAPKRTDLLRVIKVIPTNWHYDIDPSHLL